MKEIVINKDYQNVRVDKFIRSYLASAPLSLIYRLFRQGEIKINGKKCAINDPLQAGDVVRIYLKDDKIAELSKKETTLQTGKLDIIYEDDRVLIVNKPQGTEVQVNSKPGLSSITAMVNNYLQPVNGHPVHRLDVGTTGVLIYGKGRAPSVALTEAFRLHNIKKKYLALVVGDVKSNGSVVTNLKKVAGNKSVKADQSEVGSKESRLSFIVKQRFGRFTLLEVKIETGRHHQIRAQLADIGFPLVGDGKYGDFAINRKYRTKGFLLHAAEVEITDIGGELSYLRGKKFQAPLGERFNAEMLRVVELSKKVL